jgi:hypothetical protein
VSYARNLLSRGEEVVHESRQHWFAVVARTWLWVVLAIIALSLVPAIWELMRARNARRRMAAAE